MPFQSLKKRKFWWRCMALVILLPILLFGVLVLYIYSEQDDIIQNEISILNTQHKGLITIGDTHLSLFSNFPDLSFKIDDVKIYETKEITQRAILDVADIYIGFNIWDILDGTYQIRSLIVDEGFFDIVFHTDGTINLQNALKPLSASEGNPDEFATIQLKNITLYDLDIHKKDETNIRI